MLIFLIIVSYYCYRFSYCSLIEIFRLTIVTGMLFIFINIRIREYRSYIYIYIVYYMYIYNTVISIQFTDSGFVLCDYKHICMLLCISSLSGRDINACFNIIQTLFSLYLIHTCTHYISPNNHCAFRRRIVNRLIFNKLKYFNRS